MLIADASFSGGDRHRTGLVSMARAAVAHWASSKQQVYACIVHDAALICVVYGLYVGLPIRGVVKSHVGKHGEYTS